MRMGSIGVQAIGSIMLPDKLVFVGVHHKFPVIASQCAHWRGNPPVERNQVTARWFAMTGNMQRTLSNTNLSD